MPKIRTLQRGGTRYYIHPTTRDRVPGVTSIVGMLPKGFLMYWAAKKVATEAVDNLGAIVSLALTNRDGAIDFLKRAPTRDTREAADIGTAAHAIFEKLALGERAPLHPELRPFADHFTEFQTQLQPRWLHVEESLWSDTHRYAGTCDAIAEIAGETVIIDFKTTRSGVHEDVSLQLAAYAAADYIIRPDGSQLPLPRIAAGRVLHIRPEGWKFVPVAIDRGVLNVFLALRQVWEWDSDGKNRVLGDPIATGKFVEDFDDSETEFEAA